MQLICSAEYGGRVLKYNLETKETVVLMRNLQFPNGVSLSKDGSFFVFCEGAIGRTNENGDSWVAIHNRRTFYTYFCALYPKVRKFLLKLPIPVKIQYLLQMRVKLHAVVVKYSQEGKLLQILEDRQGKVVRAVSEWKKRMGNCGWGVF
ncbi:Adipocyte plasma membrane-associated protein [Morella rubra]|uniref:Adipocyte plasma membrane-associated protein n=1 Tax=Morella rubra TaxID=262757 RepID=A0A6A1WNV1_9ROSI|nr:Adipocyte plasma membrane-associated protein [Morella rubra]